MTDDDGDDGTPMNDVVMIAALGFIILFIAAFLQIRPPMKTDASVKLQAEFVLSMTWPDGAYDDIDLWLMLPDGKKVFFRNQDVEYVTLDRDDLGAANDYYTDAEGKRQVVQINREMMTIRAIVPGRYVVAAHVYGVRFQGGNTETEKNLSASQKLPYQAHLEVTKLNPRIVEVLRASAALSEKGQEVVFAAFEVDADGNAHSIELNPSQYQIVDLVPTFEQGAIR